MPRTDFRTTVDDFAFRNSWTYDTTERNAIRGILTAALSAVGGPIGTIAGLTISISGQYGLCGGMAFAALDYYNLGWVVPRGSSQDNQPTRSTPAGTILRNYMWSRLIDSLNSNGGTFLDWMANLNLVPEFLGGGSPCLLRRSRVQWTRLKQHIDAGQPWPIGLIGTTSNPTSNHQVLAIGYEEPGDGSGTIYVYDSNSPGGERRITMANIASVVGNVLMASEEAASPARGPLRGFFCEAYSPRVPPVAVGLSQGLSSTPSGARNLGDTVTFNFTAANYSFSSVPPLALHVVGRALVNNENCDAGGGGAARTVMAAGANRPISHPAVLAGTAGLRDCAGIPPPVSWER